MTNLSRFQTEDGIELVIDTTTGEAFATVTGYAKLSRKDKSTISRRLKGVASEELKNSEMLTPGGLQGVVLIPAKLVFKWAIKDNPELAEKMGDAGATVFIHQLAGYKVSSTAVEPPKPQTMLEWAEAFVASEKARLVAEEAKLLLQAENEVLKQEVEGLSEIVDELFDYSSIIRIAKFNNVPETRFEWWVLKKASKAENLEIKKAPCQRYGQKNLYNHTAWRRAYPGIKLPETTTLTRINAD